MLANEQRQYQDWHHYQHTGCRHKFPLQTAWPTRHSIKTDLEGLSISTTNYKGKKKFVPAGDEPKDCRHNYSGHYQREGDAVKNAQIVAAVYQRGFFYFYRQSI